MRMTLWVARAGFLLTLVGVSACESGPPPTGLEAPSPAVDAIGLAGGATRAPGLPLDDAARSEMETHLRELGVVA